MTLKSNKIDALATTVEQGKHDRLRAADLTYFAPSDK